MTNFFKLHTNNFIDAADYIHQHCISFAGKSIRAPHSPWAYMCFAQAFSHCDDAVAALNFECVSNEGLACIASVSVDGTVSIEPAEGWYDRH